MKKLTQTEAFEMMDDITVTISDLIDRWVDGDPKLALDFIEVIKMQLQEERHLALVAIERDNGNIQDIQD